MMTIGVDPGASGGFATASFLRDGLVVEVFKMPEGLEALSTFIWNLARTQGSPVCYIEDVGYHMAGNGAQSSATFARHCGHLEALLTAYGFRIVKVKPKKWMALLPNVPSGKGSKGDRKRYIRDLMKLRYPKLDKQINLKTADALGILDVMYLQEEDI